MAEEMQFFRSKINTPQDNNLQTLAFDRAQLAPHSLMMKQNNNNLIEVSDDEDDETTEPDEESENESEEESEHESEEESEEESYNDDLSDEDDEKDTDIHGVLDLTPMEFDNEDTNISLNNIKSIVIDNSPHEEMDFENENIDLTTLPIPHLKDETENVIPEKEDTMNLNDVNIKSISITDMDDLDVLDEIPDYKKMNVNKLRDVVVKKKLVSDASKMKKPDLLKLLGVE